MLPVRSSKLIVALLPRRSLIKSARELEKQYKTLYPTYKDSCYTIGWNAVTWPKIFCLSFQVTYLWKFRGRPGDSTHGIVRFDGKFWARGCDEKQNKKNVTGSADSTVNLAGNSRGDAAADVFSLRYAAGRAACPHKPFFSCVSNVGFDIIMRMHNKIMTRIYINWTRSYAYGTRPKTS